MKYVSLFSLVLSILFTLNAGAEITSAFDAEAAFELETNPKAATTDESEPSKKAINLDSVGSDTCDSIREAHKVYADALKDLPPESTFGYDPNFDRRLELTRRKRQMQIAFNQQSCNRRYGNTLEENRNSSQTPARDRPFCSTIMDFEESRRMYINRECIGLPRM